VGTSPSAVVVGDFNGDGKPDLAVANSGSANVSVLLGNGDGTFKDAVNSSAGPSPQALAVGDFSGDHKLDVIVISPGVANMLLGNGDGTFQPLVKISAGQSPVQLVVGDLNGDKKKISFVGDQSDESLGVLLGKGDGTFQPASTISLGSSGAISSIVVADFTGTPILMWLQRHRRRGHPCGPRRRHIPAPTLVADSTAWRLLAGRRFRQ